MISDEELMEGDIFQNMDDEYQRTTESKKGRAISPGTGAYGKYESSPSENLYIPDYTENKEIAKRTAVSSEGKSISYGSSYSPRSASKLSSGGSMSASSVSPIESLPKLEYPTFTAPERDESRVSELRAKASGAGLRELRRQVQLGIQSSWGMDAAARRMTLREALQGYGSGLSKIMGQADITAQRQYEQEYQTDYKESLTNYQAGISKANMEYEANLRRLLHNAQAGVKQTNAITASTSY